MKKKQILHVLINEGSEDHKLPEHRVRDFREEQILQDYALLQFLSTS